MLKNIFHLMLSVLLLQGFLFLANAQQELFSDPTTDQINFVDQARHKENTEKSFIKRHRMVSRNKGLILNTKIQTITLNCFQDTKFIVHITKVEAEGVENLWTGTVEGFPLSSVEIYYDVDCAPKIEIILKEIR